MLKVSENLKSVLLEANSEKTLDLLKSKNSTIQYLDIAIENSNRISYITEDRNHRFKGDFWNADLRKSFAYMGKVGKVLNRINQDIQFKTPEIEKIQALMVKENKANMDSFVILDGEDIRKWYNGENYAENSGTLNSSCMKSEDCQSYFDIYVSEPNIKMLAYIKNDKLHGRAILWTGTDMDSGEDLEFIDRIYGTNQMIELFKLYAEKNNLGYKVEQNYNNCEITNKEGKVFNSIKVELENYYESFPYMDTMKYLNNTTLYSNSYCNSYELELTDTEGNMANYYYCECCEDRHHEGDLYYVEGEDIRVCSDCIDGENYIEVDYNVYSVDSDDIFLCNDCGEYHTYRNNDYIIVDNEVICDNCTDDYYFCEVCSEYYYRENTDFYNIDNTYICEHCIADMKV